MYLISEASNYYLKQKQKIDFLKISHCPVSLIGRFLSVRIYVEGKIFSAANPLDDHAQTDHAANYVETNGWFSSSATKLREFSSSIANPVDGITARETASDKRILQKMCKFRGNRARKYRGRPFSRMKRRDDSNGECPIGQVVSKRDFYRACHAESNTQTSTLPIPIRQSTTNPTFFVRPLAFFYLNIPSRWERRGGRKKRAIVAREYVTTEFLWLEWPQKIACFRPLDFGTMNLARQIFNKKNKQDGPRNLVFLRYFCENKYIHLSKSVLINSLLRTKLTCNSTLQ